MVNVIIGGNAYGESFHGTESDDEIHALGGNDFIYLSTGSDYVDGGGGYDWLIYDLTTNKTNIAYVTNSYVNIDSGFINTRFDNIEMVQISLGEYSYIDSSNFSGASNFFTKGKSSIVLGGLSNNVLEVRTNIINSGAAFQTGPGFGGSFNGGPGYDIAIFHIADSHSLLTDITVNAQGNNISAFGITQTINNVEQVRLIDGDAIKHKISLDAHSFPIGIWLDSDSTDINFIGSQFDDRIIVRDYNDDLLFGGATIDGLGGFDTVLFELAGKDKNQFVLLQSGDQTNIVETNVGSSITKNVETIAFERSSYAGSLDIDGSKAFVNVEVHSSDASDRFIGGGGSDIFFSSDQMFNDAGSIDVVDGGPGVDTINFSSQGKYSNGISFNLAIYTTQDTIGAGLITAKNFENIVGSAQRDILTGSTENNVITGGGEADTLTGGSGNDIFRDTLANMNGDTITDLSVGDRINVTDASYGAFTYLHSGAALTVGATSVTIGSPALRLAVAMSTNAGTDLIAVAHSAQLSDFNGDGHSDLLWQNTNGAISSWSVAGNAAASQVTANSFFAQVDASWNVVETFDFNGDGRADILWRNTSGAVSVWTASGANGFTAGAYNTGSPGAAWKIAATGDIDGDGKDDLLWRNDDGSISAWRATGTGFDQNSYYHASVGTGWKVAALADVDGDGRVDIVWRNANGAVSVWRSTGTGFAEGSINHAPVGLDWHIAGTGDLNGDGRDDLVWRNDNGAVTAWLSTGSGFSEGQFNASAPTNWQIAQIADFNDDGRADLLFHNDSGAISIWQSNGAGFDQNVLYNPGANPAWQIQAHEVLG